MKNLTPKENECVSGQSEKISARKSQINGVTLTEDAVREMINEAKAEVLEKARKESKDEITKQVQMDKVSLMTVFGIFASILFILTGEFQFLRTITEVRVILGFSLVMFAQLFSFNIALDYLAKTRLDKETPKPNLWFCGFVCALFILGLVAIVGF